MSSVTKAVEILKCFSTERTELSVSGVSAQLGMPKSSVSRLLSEMERLGLLQRNERTRRYSPGYLMFQLGTLYHLRFDMLDIVERLVRELVRETGQIGYVGIPVEGKIVALQTFPGAHPLRYELSVGKRYPAHNLSFGKALLARRTDAEIRAIFERAPGDAPPDIEAFLAEIRTIRTRGWATQEVTSIPGVHGVGLALVSHISGEAVGFSLSYPATQLSREAVNHLVLRLVEGARRIASLVRDPFWLMK